MSIKFDNLVGMNVFVYILSSILVMVVVNGFAATVSIDSVNRSKRVFRKCSVLIYNKQLSKLPSTSVTSPESKVGKAESGKTA